MARIRDLGINFIPTPSRTDIELTPVVMAAADGGGDEENYKECDEPGSPPCSLTDGDEECDGGGPGNPPPCSLTDGDEECDGGGSGNPPPCSLTDGDCDGPEYNCSNTDEDCDGPKNNCSNTDDEDEDEDGDDQGAKQSTKGLRACDVAQLTEQLENHLTSELEN